MKNIAALLAENARDRNRSHRQHRLARAQLPRDEGRDEQRAGGERGEHLALPQPAALPRTRPHTIPSTPAVISARPGMSSAAAGPRLSRIRVSTSGIAIAPIGTLSQKIHSQSRPCTTAPPTSGPAATERPVTR